MFVSGKSVVVSDQTSQIGFQTASFSNALPTFQTPGTAGTDAYFPVVSGWAPKSILSYNESTGNITKKWDSLTRVLQQPFMMQNYDLSSGTAYDIPEFSFILTPESNTISIYTVSFWMEYKNLNLPAGVGYLKLMLNDTTEITSVDLLNDTQSNIPYTTESYKPARGFIYDPLGTSVNYYARLTPLILGVGGGGPTNYEFLPVETGATSQYISISRDVVVLPQGSTSTITFRIISPADARSNITVDAAVASIKKIL